MFSYEYDNLNKSDKIYIVQGNDIITISKGGLGKSGNYLVSDGLYTADYYDIKKCFTNEAEAKKFISNQ